MSVLFGRIPSAFAIVSSTDTISFMNPLMHITSPGVSSLARLYLAPCGIFSHYITIVQDEHYFLELITSSLAESRPVDSFLFVRF